MEAVMRRDQLAVIVADAKHHLDMALMEGLRRHNWPSDQEEMTRALSRLGVVRDLLDVFIAEHGQAPR